MRPLETRNKSVPEAQDYDEDSARCWMLMWWNKWSRGCPVALSFPVKICKREAEVRASSMGIALCWRWPASALRLGGRCESSAIHLVRGGNAYLLFV